MHSVLPSSKLGALEPSEWDVSKPANEPRHDGPCGILQGL